MLHYRILSNKYTIQVNWYRILSAKKIKMKYYDEITISTIIDFFLRFFLFSYFIYYWVNKYEFWMTISSFMQ